MFSSSGLLGPPGPRADAAGACSECTPGASSPAASCAAPKIRAAAIPAATATRCMMLRIIHLLEARPRGRACLARPAPPYRRALSSRSGRPKQPAADCQRRASEPMHVARSSTLRELRLVGRLRLYPPAPAVAAETCAPGAGVAAGVDVVPDGDAALRCCAAVAFLA